MESLKPSQVKVLQSKQYLVVLQTVVAAELLPVVQQGETEHEIKVSRFSKCLMTDGKHVPGIDFYCKACGCKIAF